ncbi:MAG: tRNA glutamyl-Q(34) synthetase GluQRS [Rhodocyclaceae bacterium]|nr:tRNA glutamyl-Q(34) synthetase GluQRS [Rhodocyclaceae bacterium]
MNTPTACGRFAPSPTGPLHFGSIIAALGSFLEAKARGGRWLVRIEDLDRERCRPHYAETILRQLEAHGFAWDDDVVYQSQRTARYEEALERLKALGMIYPCGCTRRELAGARLGADGAPVYPGTCRRGLAPGKQARALRVRMEGVVEFVDLIQGAQRQDLAQEAGDCVVRRADGHFAYQLAVVVDDADAGVDHVVRGADLIASTARQIYLYGLLERSIPQYAHLPVAVDAQGHKLSKQTRAQPVDARDPTATLFAAAQFLGLAPPRELRRAPPQEFLAWAKMHWSLSRVPPCVRLPAPVVHSR